MTAQQQKFNVVLVDTAGRMQDNEPLMISLAKVHIYTVTTYIIHCLYNLSIHLYLVSFPDLVKN